MMCEKHKKNHCIKMATLLNWNRVEGIPLLHFFRKWYNYIKRYF